MKRLYFSIHYVEPASFLTDTWSFSPLNKGSRSVKLAANLNLVPMHGYFFALSRFHISVSAQGNFHRLRSMCIEVNTFESHEILQMHFILKLYETESVFGALLKGPEQTA
jgi:hypothetical protein